MQVWVTRAQPGADQTAARLRALGCDPLVAPVLEVQPTGVALPSLDGVGALAFTSANAVRAFAAASGRRDLPAFAVGNATAEAAEAAGFRSVASADGDVAALGRLIDAKRAVFEGAVLHPCAEEPAGDLPGALKRLGVSTLAAPLYRTVAIAGMPRVVAASLAAASLDVVVVHSRKAASVLAALLDAPELTRGVARLRVVGVSAASVTPLAGVPLASRAYPPCPRESAMLERLAP